MTFRRLLRRFAVEAKTNELKQIEHKIINPNVARLLDAQIRDQKKEAIASEVPCSRPLINIIADYDSDAIDTKDIDLQNENLVGEYLFDLQLDDARKQQIMNNMHNLILGDAVQPFSPLVEYFKNWKQTHRFCLNQQTPAIEKYLAAFWLMGASSKGEFIKRKFELTILFKDKLMKSNHTESFSKALDNVEAGLHFDFDFQFQKILPNLPLKFQFLGNAFTGMREKKPDSTYDQINELTNRLSQYNRFLYLYEGSLDGIERAGIERAGTEIAEALARMDREVHLEKFTVKSDPSDLYQVFKYKKTVRTRDNYHLDLTYSQKRAIP